MTCRGLSLEVDVDGTVHSTLRRASSHATVVMVFNANACHTMPCHTIYDTATPLSDIDRLICDRRTDDGAVNIVHITAWYGAVVRI